MWSSFAAYHRMMLGETLLKGIIINIGRFCRRASCKAKYESRVLAVKLVFVLMEGSETHPNKPFKHSHWHIPIMRQWHYTCQFKKASSHELSSLTFLTACFSNRKYLPWPCLVGTSSKVPLCHALFFVLLVYVNVMSCLLWILDK